MGLIFAAALWLGGAGLVVVGAISQATRGSASEFDDSSKGDGDEQLRNGSEASRHRFTRQD